MAYKRVTFYWTHIKKAHPNGREDIKLHIQMGRDSSHQKNDMIQHDTHVKVEKLFLGMLTSYSGEVSREKVPNVKGTERFT